jgi:HD-GYP domain-containing protein (c-di-GMP phosphodiesterase class II)
VDAITELRRVAGTQLDPAAVEAFVNAFPNADALPLSA